MRKNWTVVFIILGICFSSTLFAEGKMGRDDFWKMYFQEYHLPKPAFTLKYPGASIFFDYGKYINDPQGLKEALGEGIFPNTDVYKDPDYKRMRSQGLLNGSHWDLLRSKDYKKAFFIWTQAPEETGVRLYFMATVLEKAGLIQQAIKAYYAAAILDPNSTAWAADHSFVWYIAPTAISSVERLCRDYSGLDCALKGDSFISNPPSNDPNQRTIKFNPGKIVHRSIADKIKAIPDLNSVKVTEVRGQGLVKAVEYANGHWQLMVDGKPFYVKGITYLPTEIGLGPDNDPDFDSRWMFSDKNKNGIIDAPYEAWDQPSHKPVGDFQILKDMGINTIRLYVPNKNFASYDPKLINKPLLRDMYKRFGIRAVLGDFLGAYTQGSGASWDKGTDYTDPLQRAKMKAIVRAKVMDLKDEPFVLMWILGNENNLPADFMGANATRTNAASQPKAYAQFLNEVAEMIHQIDPNHPVAVGNVEMGLLDDYNKYAPALDIIGVNSYRGKEGFGSLFVDAKSKFDRPILITEYGCDAYTDNKGPDEDRQLDYLKGNFRDLVYNKPGGPGVGNAIGGVIFEYLDEWWKAHGEAPDQHVADHLETGPTPDGYFHEEWFGIAGQNEGKNSPFERHLRKAYYYFKDILNEVPDN